jgi:hypothetical protein
MKRDRFYRVAQSVNPGLSHHSREAWAQDVRRRDAYWEKFVKEFEI